MNVRPSARLLLYQPQQLLPADVVNGLGQPVRARPDTARSSADAWLSRTIRRAVLCAWSSRLPAPCGAGPRPGAGLWPGSPNPSACGTASAARGRACVRSPAGTGDSGSPGHPSDGQAGQPEVDAHLPVARGQRHRLALCHERSVVPAVRLTDHRDRRRYRRQIPRPLHPDVPDLGDIQPLPVQREPVAGQADGLAPVLATRFRMPDLRPLPVAAERAEPVLVCAARVLACLHQCDRGDLPEPRPLRDELASVITRRCTSASLIFFPAAYASSRTRRQSLYTTRAQPNTRPAPAAARGTGRGDTGT